jgi:esterase/lipase superfamily enzyme
MMPVLVNAVPDSSHVEMLVATTRAPDASPAIMFSGQRGEGVAFADIEVSLPPDRSRKIGEVQWPQAVPGNPATDFVTRKTQIIDRTTALAWVDREAKGSAKRQVLVFVHGFNNKFEDAVYRFAQIVHDSGSGAVPVLFTWPSKGDVLSYGYDRDSTDYSRTQLETLLRSLAGDPQVGEISILAHSMGNWLALESLRQMAIRDGRVNGKIRNVLLASPDVDVDVARTQIADMGPNRPQFSLFVSRDDKALGLAKDLWGGSTRLGAIDPSVEPYHSQLAAERITVFDLTAVKSADTMGGALGHTKFATSPQIVQLIGSRLASGQAITDSREDLGDQFQGATGAVSNLGSSLLGRLGGS